MEKIRTHYLVDVLMGLSFVLTALSGIVIFFFLPGGRQAGMLEFWNVARQDWMAVHSWSGIALIAFVILHLILHWNWITCMTKGMFKKKKEK